MPVHDWTRVDAGIFHSFHTTWIAQINTALNSGLLPDGYYALAEQHAGESIADVLTLHAAREEVPGTSASRLTGGTLVADAPPRVRHRQTFQTPSALHPRTVAVRHVSGHKLVAIIEIVSPANKDRLQHVETFAAKVLEALELGIHVLIVDLFPPSRFDPHGIHAVIRQRLAPTEEIYDLPPTEPLTLAAYAAGLNVEVYIEHLAVGTQLPDMPLFLLPDRYVNIPLQPTYDAAYRGVPAIWRDALNVV